MKRFAATIVLAVSIPGVALAAQTGASALGDLKAADCVSGRVQPQNLVDAMVQAEGVPLSRGNAALLTSGSLGTKARTCAADKCDGDRAALGTLYRHAENLFVIDGALTTKDAQATVASGAPVSAADRAEALLNNQADAWLAIACKSPQANTVKPPPAPPASGGLLPSGLIIAGAATDLAQPDVTKRTFATVGYTHDAVAKTDQKTANIFVGLDAPLFGGAAVFQPYASYQRSTSPKPASNLDDLAFGAGGLGLFRLDSTYVWTASAAWVTDDAFRSSQTIIQFGLQPSWPQILGLCGKLFTTASTSLSCTLNAAADYSKVGDPGLKVALAKAPQYFRLGSDLGMMFDWNPNTAGTITASANYSFRDAVDGSRSDADLLTLALGYQPAKATNFNIGLSYTRGKALASLTSSDLFQIKLGYRH